MNMKILMVELTNHCNEDCWFCPHSKMIREKGFMSMDTVKQVISKIEPGNYTLFVTYLGFDSISEFIKIDSDAIIDKKIFLKKSSGGFSDLAALRWWKNRRS